MNILECAQSDLAKVIRETSPNDGVGLREMLSNTGWQPGMPWCAASVSHWAKLAGAGEAFPYSLSSQAIMRAFSAKGNFTERPEALLAMTGALGGWTDHPDTSHGHIFLVTGRLTDASGHIVGVETIEGNSNDLGGSNGDGLYSHRRLFEDTKHSLWFLDCSHIPGCSYWQ